MNETLTAQKLLLLELLKIPECKRLARDILVAYPELG
jgi:hypothetical protein